MRHRCIPRDSARTSTAHNSETKQPEFDLHRKKKKKRKEKTSFFCCAGCGSRHPVRFRRFWFQRPFFGVDLAVGSSAMAVTLAGLKCLQVRRVSWTSFHGNTGKKTTTTTTTTASEDLRVFRIGHSDDEDGVVLQVKAPEALVGAAGVQVPYFKTLRCHTKSTQFNAINHAAHGHQTRSASLWPVAATWSYPWRVPYESTRRTFAPVAEIVGAESIKSYSPIGINGIDDIRREKKNTKKKNKQTKNNRWHRTDRSALREGPLLIS